MRRVSLFLAIALLTLTGLTACNSLEKKTQTASSNAPQTPSAKAVPKDGIRRITVVELRELLAKNEAVVIDVRTQESYDIGHIQGAKLIPVGDTANHIDELPKDKLIVTYCSCGNEQTSVGAAVTMRTKGVENTAALLGGFPAWQKAGLPVGTKQSKT